MNKSEYLEHEIIASIILNNDLINDLYIDTKCFLNPVNKKTIDLLKRIYQENKIITM